MAELGKGRRVSGGVLLPEIGRELVALAAGASIRELAASTGRSYGFVHRILSESGATLRGRGGATRGKSAKAS